MIEKIKAIGNKIVIKKDALAKKVNGIYVTKNVINVIGATVISVGDGTHEGLKKGDKILIDKGIGKRIDFDGEPFFVIKEPQIIAVVE